MEYLKNMKVSSKLSFGFGVLLLLLLASSSLALFQAASIGREVDTMEQNNQKVELLYAMRRANFDNERSVRDLILDGADHGREILSRIAKAREDYAKAKTALEAIPHDVEGRKANEAISAAQHAAVALHDRLITIASANDDEAAKQLLYGEAQSLMSARAASLQAAIDRQERRNSVSADSVDQSIRTSRNLLITFAAIALIAGCSIAWWIIRSLVGPLRAAMGVAESIANGQFEINIGHVSCDETGQLLSSMDTMAQRLRSFSIAQQDMARRHSEGELDFRIDAGAFPGDFGRIAADTNALIGESVGLIEHIIDLVQSYAVGDLSQDMERLPGEKARFTEAVATTKRNLSAINEQIHRLASAAAVGDFSQRGDETAFGYEFKVMIERLNMMMQVSDENLRQLSSLLRSIASGDLTAQMDGASEGVFGQMRDDANRTVAQLTEIIGRIQTAANSISTAATEIASGNNDLSRRTEQQAANLEETAASMEELTSTVRQNAEHARQANELAINAGVVATGGGIVVEQVVSTMRDIEASSTKIADIIGVIDGIAFQTNILALNAAVEAARAGDQGRGFAVVASEVRSLAQRSASAAKEIKQLIDDSVSRVALGTSLVDRAGTTMSELVGSVQRVTGIMAEISAASNEQSAGIEQVSQTVVQLDETTQQNAALVEEATAAARSMEEQAVLLSEAVSRFRLATTQVTPMSQRGQPLVPAPHAVPAPLTCRPAFVLNRMSAARGAAITSAPEGDWQEF